MHMLLKAAACSSLLVALTNWPAHAQTPPHPEEPAQAVARMLQATGGREAWRSVTGMINVATQYIAERPLPQEVTIWNDFTTPRFRVWAKNGMLDRSFAINGDKGTALRDGEFRLLDEAQVRDELQWWRGNVYRTLARLARQDAALGARWNADGRLEIWEGGARLNWFRLNFAGEPVQFGSSDDGGTVFGPWVPGPAGTRHPKWGASADGGWQFEIRRIELNPAFGDGWFVLKPPADRRP